MPDDPSTTPRTSIIDLAAETRKAWGPKWNAPELEYEFSGRKFYRRTDECAIYATSPDHNL